VAAPPPFTEAIRAVVRGLRDDAHTHARINDAAAAIDNLGRHLHGVGFVRDREIAGCFTAAFGELSASHALAEDARGASVNGAVRHLEAALLHAQAGLLPDP
jgi:hypothetical protein